jgi:hypothetical protein
MRIVLIAVALASIVGCGGGMQANQNLSAQAAAQVNYQCMGASGNLYWCQMPPSPTSTGTTGTGSTGTGTVQ